MKPGLELFAAAVLSGAFALGGPARAAEEEKPKGGPKELAGLKYRSVGPDAGGRVSRAAGVPGDPLTYYAATASGGVWKSTDGGHRWKPDLRRPAHLLHRRRSRSRRPNPNVVYVGSGEANIRGNVAAGNGIYKSTDAGKTWTHVWKQEGQIGTMIVHPKNPDVAFAAVLGHAFGPNPERGVYRTSDGGKTWQRVLFKDADTGAVRRLLRPAEPQRPLRRPVAGPPASVGDRRAADRAAASTSRATVATAGGASTGKGLPEGILGKIGVAVAPSDSRRVYALIEAEKGGLFRSDDGGESWHARERPPRAPAAGLVLHPRSRSIRRTPTWSGSRRCRC